MIGFLGSLWPEQVGLDKLNELNTTAFRIVHTTRLFTLVVIVATAVFVRESWLGHDEAASNILDTMMLALFGFAGVNAAQFAAKRFSHTPYAAAKASGAPAQVVQTTGTVVAQNPGGPVDAAPTTVAVAGQPAALPVAPIVASRAGTHGIGSALSPGANQPSERDWTTAPRRAAVSEPDLYRDDERGD